jgi:L-aminoadipate-semialdehyde dehydrogenase
MTIDIGYGQSKWVSEYLTREAGRRGLKGAIVRYINTFQLPCFHFQLTTKRPGYISGDSRTGGQSPAKSNFIN